MSREVDVGVEGKFLGKIKGFYKSTPIIITPDIPPCHSTQSVFTRKLRNDTIVITHTNENGVINIEQQIVKK
jgi:hypothetical protein